MADIRFDGKVAIVTGAGGGLGRQHALELARRGAKVVVNDLGGSVDGSGGSSAAAEAVVAEIKAFGGEAIANGSSVTDDAGVANMVKQTMDAWGRIDILVANAGILRDKSFSKMEMSDFEAVMNVHVMGTVKPAKAVWEIMKAQNYGRILVTTSSTGLYGNFGQANYGAAKLALIGFMNTMKLEGQKNNIHVNAISPVAATRMTENLMPAEVLEKLKPEYVTPAVVYLVSEEAPTGVILTAGAGAFAQARIYETEGVYLGEGGLSVEEVRDNFARITDPGGQKAYVNGGEQSGKFFRKMQGG
ncbi:MAG: SDR family NAD(P)-dependent oxidoreductase [Phenylobacterium sp.]|jgi:NAD(P)-dependent dehydrogenase (short-subunit alcohol dehydrogenase family)|uniref:SDR family NAD(P)-dependent oxidoreductase n=1 Tax=Phenylobacterium sp. TaxID=1871053 RepID=UPI0025D0076D|nr:SDR family NAD(P)-dependent oxidoreductase [Phenylobacterium sp.]MCA3711048.1 SDR family NAD(P)-dependent oxidoreductase [Phenylobacterium sp.]MCA3724554.1 SDR family NAD(P)-dependent oxidoreductase [Phenylobacterium sp.]MCA6246677.1 SDR family NAD(P)-dependent oxidoreductase [Phenylobacterium sp.]MCA6253827.1 SDR family NAD(P)-dependent oxidoreductase [Phenylobacterium sp.]MCA6320039.1 SDR family NAD(P)-dependent oxidoreductase [Phenylobacterium sp.]